MWREWGVEGGATLLNKRKMESRRKGNRFEKIREGRLSWISRVNDAPGRVVVAPRDRRVHSHIQARDGVCKNRARIKIGIGNAAVLRPKAGINGELRKIRESSLLYSPIRFAAW